MGRILLVHFSDLHFGSDLIGTDSTVPGLRGHDLLLCGHLRAVTRRRGQSTIAADFQLPAEERLHFVLGGDLTRVGSANDFYLAYQWLFDRFALYTLVGPPRPRGLQIPPGDLYSVPGNHDQWNGISPGLTNWFSPAAYNPYLAPNWFWPTPWRRIIVSPQSDFVVDLFGVDSNSGLNRARGNFFAAGAISTQELVDLEVLLSQSLADEKNDPQKRPRLRAILCHHSFVGNAATAGLQRNSVTELIRLAHEYDAAAILTGHMHSAIHDPHVSPKNHLFWELRAAAAVQRGSQPGLQGFWVHELTCEQGQPHWKAWQYETSANFGPFTRLPSPLPIR
ncbi:MAG TPA: metallophosphoesterase [Pirellulales bacterium]|jgi:hypothetical protein|nr:metallophosphoesterase [Pirellulales bacterium]